MLKALTSVFRVGRGDCLGFSLLMAKGGLRAVWSRDRTVSGKECVVVIVWDAEKKKAAISGFSVFATLLFRVIALDGAGIELAWPTDLVRAAVEFAPVGDPADGA